MIIEFIKKIQQKPKSTRLLILWVSSVIVVLIIIIIWIFTFPKNTNNKKSELVETQLPSLIKTIKDDFSSVKENIGASIKGIQAEIEAEEVKQNNEE